MTNEWKEWHGGECPVPRDTLVTVKYSYGGGSTGEAKTLDWKHRETSGDITAYRIHETTEQRIDRLERELRELKYERGLGPNPVPNPVPDNLAPEKWEPEGGHYYIEPHGAVTMGPSWADVREFGTERPTRELAEKARDAMRIHNRALAYVHEHAPDWDGSEPYMIRQNNSGRYWAQYVAYPVLGSITGPRRVMQKLADDLNSGRVQL